MFKRGRHKKRKRRSGDQVDELPLRQWFKTAIAYLGWSPETFWKSTIVEYFAAIEGYNEMQSGKTGMPPPLDRSEYELLKQKYPDKN